MLLGSHIHYVIKIMFFYDLFKTNLLHGYGCTVSVINLTKKEIFILLQNRSLASGQILLEQPLASKATETILRETTKESSCWHLSMMMLTIKLFI